MVLGIFPLSICFRPTTSDLYTYCPSSYQNVPCSVFPIQISIPLFSFIDKKNTYLQLINFLSLFQKLGFDLHPLFLFSLLLISFSFLSLSLSLSFFLFPYPFSHFLIPFSLYVTATSTTSILLYSMHSSCISFSIHLKILLKVFFISYSSLQYCIIIF